MIVFGFSFLTYVIAFGADVEPWFKGVIGFIGVGLGVVISSRLEALERRK